MTRYRCLQCDKPRARRRPEVLIRCKEGWLHYNPAICAWCLRVLEGMMEAVTPTEHAASIQRELDLRSLVTT